MQINIPNDKAQLVVDAIDELYGREENETDAQLLKRFLKNYLKNIVMKKRRRDAEATIQDPGIDL